MASIPLGFAPSISTDHHKLIAPDGVTELDNCLRSLVSDNKLTQKSWHGQHWEFMLQ